jgi:hypothetical protein
MESAAWGNLDAGIEFYLLLLPGALFLPGVWLKYRQLGTWTPRHGKV